MRKHPFVFFEAVNTFHSIPLGRTFISFPFPIPSASGCLMVARKNLHFISLPNSKCFRLFSTTSLTWPSIKETFCSRRRKTDKFDNIKQCMNHWTNWNLNLNFSRHTYHNIEKKVSKCMQKRTIIIIMFSTYGNGNQYWQTGRSVCTLLKVTSLCYFHRFEVDVFSYLSTMLIFDYHYF